jgi:uracil-DNA glycosylase
VLNRQLNLGKLVMSLSKFSAPNVFNPWSGVDPLDRITAAFDNGPNGRRTRLYQHFNCVPKYLLIGEAPGYQGCHFSGVPFTNEKLILDGAIPRVTQDGRITTRDRPWSEPSATIVWRTLHELGIAEETVMWNAFAFHPHKPGNPMSNRAPTRDELEFGKPFLHAVVEHFAHARVVAIGKVADATLRLCGVLRPYASVRHPSMGGARDFAGGMRAIRASGWVEQADIDEGQL